MEMTEKEKQKTLEGPGNPDSWRGNTYSLIKGVAGAGAGKMTKLLGSLAEKKHGRRQFLRVMSDDMWAGGLTRWRGENRKGVN